MKTSAAGEEFTSLWSLVEQRRPFLWPHLFESLRLNHRFHRHKSSFFAILTIVYIGRILASITQPSIKRSVFDLMHAKIIEPFAGIELERNFRLLSAVHCRKFCRRALPFLFSNRTFFDANIFNFAHYTSKEYIMHSFMILHAAYIYDCSRL